MSPSLTLWIAFPRIASSDFPVRPGRHVLGRAADCDLVVSHPTVSRRHAELTVEGPLVTVKDLRSRNGTFVDGKRIEKCEVSRGQWVEFGGVRFLLESSEFHTGWMDDEDLDVDSPTELAESVEKPLAASPEQTVQSLAALSKAQFRVYQLLLGGLSYKQIAARLALSQHTVHNHIRAIYRLLNVRSRSELFARFLNDTLEDG
ncbi:MAG: FHA domain-containing protein [Planctomycetes bacterium]|nr:FHA domain-containing protein [Planctomycetota bacterium]